jgi:hypothetical protein
MIIEVMKIISLEEISKGLDRRKRENVNTDKNGRTGLGNSERLLC